MTRHLPLPTSLRPSPYPPPPPCHTPPLNPPSPRTWPGLQQTGLPWPRRYRGPGLPSSGTVASLCPPPPPPPPAPVAQGTRAVLEGGREGGKEGGNGEWEEGGVSVFYKKWLQVVIMIMIIYIHKQIRVKNYAAK